MKSHKMGSHKLDLCRELDRTKVDLARIRKAIVSEQAPHQMGHESLGRHLPFGQGCGAEGGRAEVPWRVRQPLALPEEQPWLQGLSRAGLLAAPLPGPTLPRSPFLPLTAGLVAATPLASPPRGCTGHTGGSHRVAREL